MTDAPLELDRLLVEAAWLRRLALHLVGDAAEADDIVQETWVAALRAPRVSVLVSPRAWLAGIARRVSAGRHRGDTRRRDRELARSADPGPSGCPAADDVSARLELQRVVGEELQRLPEPYRTALFLQYYEGLSPQAIAARSGEPAGTVRWRSKRGRELLREALVARDGRAWESWALALAPFAGLAPEVGAPILSAAAPAAIAVMSKWISLSAVAGVLAALGLRASLHALAPKAATTEARSEATSPPADPRAMNDTRRSVGAPAPGGVRAEVEVAYTGPVLGRGRLRSSGSGSLDDAALSLVAADGRVVEAFVTNSAWAAPELSPGRWRLEATAEGHLATSVEVEVPASAIWTHDVELVRTGVLPVRIEASDGNDLSYMLSYQEGLFSRLSVYASAAPIPAVVPLGAEVWPASPAGTWTLRDTWRSTMPHLDPRYHGELALAAPPPLHVALLLGGHVVARGTVGEGDSVLVFRIDVVALEAMTGLIEVKPVDALTGAPATCTGELEPVGGYGRSQTLRWSEDTQVPGYVPPGDYILSIGGQWEPFATRITVRPGETVLKEVRLRALKQGVSSPSDALPNDVRAERRGGAR